MKPSEEEEAKEERGLTIALRVVLVLIIAVLAWLWVEGAKTQWWG